MPWTGHPESDAADAIRALVGDMDAANPKLDDGVYDLAIAQEPRLYGRAAFVALALSGKYAHQMTVRVGDLWREAKTLYQHFQDLAQRFLLQNKVRGAGLPFAGGVDVSDVETREQDDTVVQHAFKVGMQDADPSNLVAEQE